MKIGSILENQNIEKRIAVTPEIVKKYISLGFEVCLSENYGFSELIDNCLIKNKKKIMSILNENNFSNEDCIIILRTFLVKAKKILKLSLELEKSNDLNKTIASAKPPIF